MPLKASTPSCRSARHGTRAAERPSALRVAGQLVALVFGQFAAGEARAGFMHDVAPHFGGYPELVVHADPDLVALAPANPFDVEGLEAARRNGDPLPSDDPVLDSR